MLTLRDSKLRGLLLASSLLTAFGCSSPSAKFDCEGNCDPVCSFIGTSCDDTQHCCPGLTCKTGTCGYENATEACSPTQDCVAGLTCANGTCCGPQAATCTEDAGCCTGFSCTNGACSCLPEGGECTTGEPCCAGTTCDGTHHCRAACPGPVGACEPFGGPCTTDSNCCSAGTCHQGKCEDPKALLTCGGEGATCATSADCCGVASNGGGLDCVGISDGGHVCHLGVPGEICDSTHRCSPGLNCFIPPPPPDAGPPDAGIDDGGDDAGLDDGGDDSGIDAGAPDAGAPDAGGPVDAGEPQGTCKLPSTNHTCSLFVSGCGLGDPCSLDPNGTNQGYDPCTYKVVSNQLQYRSTPLVCNETSGFNGYCRAPIEGETCSTNCTQTPGDPRTTSCVNAFDNSFQCMPSCSTDADCRGQGVYDNYVYAPQPLTKYCVKYGTTSGCQPMFCFEEDFTDVSVLYQPCMGEPDSLCLPRYVGTASSVLGFCEATRPGLADAGVSTVGQICDPRVGVEGSTGVCGPDATCLGGRCAALCDAAGGAGTATCPADKTCISPQGVDLISDHQFGGCGDPCDPFADLAHSGCASYCGGPSVRCNWIIGDPKGSLPRGYCGAALETPTPVGQPCNPGAVDPCEVGAGCFFKSGVPTCLKLCDPQADAGSPDTCPGGQTCGNAGNLTRSGFCQ